MHVERLCTTLSRRCRPSARSMRLTGGRAATARTPARAPPATPRRCPPVLQLSGTDQEHELSFPELPQATSAIHAMHGRQTVRTPARGLPSTPRCPQCVAHLSRISHTRRAALYHLRFVCCYALLVCWCHAHDQPRLASRSCPCRQPVTTACALPANVPITMSLSTGNKRAPGGLCSNQGIGLIFPQAAMGKVWRAGGSAGSDCGGHPVRVCGAQPACAAGPCMRTRAGVIPAALRQLMPG